MFTDTWALRPDVSASKPQASPLRCASAHGNAATPPHWYGSPGDSDFNHQIPGDMMAVVPILLLILSPTLLAQEFPRMERLTTEHGLSQNMVYKILQDRQGFLWLGTRDGLSRYDGYRFMVFRHDPFDTTSLPWTSVICMTEDARGDIWLSSFGGLCKLDRRTFKFLRISHGLGNSVIQMLHGDRQGNMWIGTTHGLVRYDIRSGARQHFRSAAGNPSRLYSDTLTSLYEDRTGTIWVGTVGSYLHRYNSATGNFTRFDLGLPQGDRVYCVGEDSRGTIYCTRYLDDGGLIAIGCDRATGAVVNRIADNGRSIARYIGIGKPLHIDAADGLWVQVLSWGPRKQFVDRTTLLRIPLHGDAPELTVQAPKEEPMDRVWNIMHDRSGIFWIGTENGAIQLMLDKSQFRTYRNIPGNPGSLSDNRVRGIHSDRHGTLWVGTDNGLNRLDKGSSRWTHYLHSPQKSRATLKNVVNTIFEDADGTLFIGTNDGFHLYDRRTNTISDGYGNDLPTFQVWSFCRDRSGILWVGTRTDGVLLYDRNGHLRRRFHFTLHTSGDSAMAHPGLIWDMHLDRHGILWIATSIGLYRWLPERGAFRKYGIYPDDPHGMSEATVCAIMEDTSGVLWFSTYAGGLNRYNRHSDDFTYISSRDGLPSNAIYGTLMDGAGKLWISSNTGLASYDPSTGNTRVYTTDDGLQGNEFSFNAFHKTSDGEMIFGGIHGLNMFHPDSLRTNREEAPVVVTEFRVFDTIMRRELLDGDTVEVAYSQGFLSFEFAMLNYANPASIRYSYRLAGFDRDWIYCGDRRYASFTNLDPGTYTFMVKGTNSDGVSGTRPLRVVLKVIPSFWMTWWFKGGTIGGIILITAAGAILWVRSIRRKEMLQRQGVESQLQALRLQVNPHFIFNALSSIQHLILIADRQRAVEYLSRFAHLVRAILDNSERTSIPLADDIENLRNYLDLEMFRFEGKFNYTIDIPPEFDTRHILIPTMLIQPCVENAIRHGLLHKQGEGTLKITITGREDLIHCAIEDDGVGREHAMRLRQASGHDRRSMGIRVTEERLNILNAASRNRKPISMNIIDLHDHRGDPAGTRVELFIPIESI